MVIIITAADILGDASLNGNVEKIQTSSIESIARDTLWSFFLGSKTENNYWKLSL